MATQLILPSPGNYLKGKFTLLFISLVLLFIFFPFVAERAILLDLFFTLLLLAAIYALSTRKILWIIALCIVLPDLILTWTVQFMEPQGIWFFGLHYKQLLQLNTIWRTLFLTFTGVNILANIMKTPRVSVDTLFGSFCVYLLVALIWAETYAIMESFSPGSFQFNTVAITLGRPLDHPMIQMPNFLYYSFVTLTTLGYGDITPLTLHAKVFAAFEAVFGQLYLTVLVARLVGLHISGSQHRD